MLTHLRGRSEAESNSSVAVHNGYSASLSLRLSSGFQDPNLAEAPET